MWFGKFGVATGGDEKQGQKEQVDEYHVAQLSHPSWGHRAKYCCGQEVEDRSEGKV